MVAANAHHRREVEDHGDYAAAADGALGTGAIVVATAQVAAFGGPAGLALLAGVFAGVLAHQVTKDVKVAQIGRLTAERARAAAHEIGGRARRRT